VIPPSRRVALGRLAMLLVALGEMSDSGRQIATRPRGVCPACKREQFLVNLSSVDGADCRFVGEHLDGGRRCAGSAEKPLT
jgi:hypothetical protein